MSQPPPIPSPFDGNPAKYLRFRANFRDQVESKASLTNGEKMNYLMSYTTGRAKKVIENYQGLPNGNTRFARRKFPISREILGMVSVKFLTRQ